MAILFCLRQMSPLPHDAPARRLRIEANCRPARGRAAAVFASRDINSGARLGSLHNTKAMNQESRWAGSPAGAVIGRPTTRSRGDEQWLARLEELRAYAKETGDCMVPKRYPANPQLGRWVGVQRLRRRSDELPGWKVQALDEVGFCWDPREATWSARYSQLRLFRDKHGHCLVPTKTPELGTWVADQRREYQRGAMDAGKITELGKLGFVWNARDAIWEQQYLRLEAYCQREGHCVVPQSHPELGRWVNSQRSALDTLHPDRVARLDMLGFIWDVKEARWEENYLELVMFQCLHGHCRVLYAKSGLGRWVAQQRKLQRDGKLSVTREKRLKALGFDSDAADI